MTPFSERTRPGEDWQASWALIGVGMKAYDDHRCGNLMFFANVAEDVNDPPTRP